MRQSELKHKFKLKKAQLHHLEMKGEANEAAKHLVSLELLEIQDELISLNDDLKKQQQEIQEVEALNSTQFLDLEKKQELQTNLVSYPKGNSSEITLDFTQGISVVEEPSKDSMKVLKEGIANYLNEE